MHCATLRGKMLRVVYHTHIKQTGGLFYTVFLARAANHRYSRQINFVSEAWWWIFSKWRHQDKAYRLLHETRIIIPRQRRLPLMKWNPFRNLSRWGNIKVNFYWSRFLFCTPTVLTLLATPSFYPKCRQGRKEMFPSQCRCPDGARP